MKVRKDAHGKKDKKKEEARSAVWILFIYVQFLINTQLDLISKSYFLSHSRYSCCFTLLVMTGYLSN